jgi:hypothetical protein
MHHECLERLARAAALDGVVTEDERLDLLTVAELLSVEKQGVLAILERAAAAGSPRCGPRARSPNSQPTVHASACASRRRTASPPTRSSSSRGPTTTSWNRARERPV